MQKTFQPKMTLILVEKKIQLQGQYLIVYTMQE